MAPSMVCVAAAAAVLLATGGEGVELRGAVRQQVLSQAESGAGALDWSKPFGKMKGYAFSEGALGEPTKVGRPGKCARMCKKEDGCVAYTFGKESGMCTLYGEDALASAHAEPDTLAGFVAPYHPKETAMMFSKRNGNRQMYFSPTTGQLRFAGSAEGDEMLAVFSYKKYFGAIVFDASVGNNMCLGIKDGDVYAEPEPCDGSEGQRWVYDEAQQQVMNPVMEKCLTISSEQRPKAIRCDPSREPQHFAMVPAEEHAPTPADTPPAPVDAPPAPPIMPTGQGIDLPEPRFAPAPEETTSHFPGSASGSPLGPPKVDPSSILAPAEMDPEMDPAAPVAPGPEPSDVLVMIQKKDSRVMHYLTNESHRYLVIKGKEDDYESQPVGMFHETADGRYMVPMMVEGSETSMCAEMLTGANEYKRVALEPCATEGVALENQQWAPKMQMAADDGGNYVRIHNPDASLCWGMTSAEERGKSYVKVNKCKEMPENGKDGQTWQRLLIMV